PMYRGNPDPSFLSPEETADYAMQGGMRLPSADEARVANSDRLLNQMRNWYQQRSLSDPLSRTTGPTPERMQATRDCLRSPLKNWNGDPIESAPSQAAGSETGAAPQPEEDLTPILRESLKQAMLRKKKP